MPRKYPDEEKTSLKLSRSTKLRKYASAYKSYVRKTEQSKVSKSPRRSRKRLEKPEKSSRSRRDTHEEETKPKRENKERKPKTDNHSSKSRQTKSKRKSLNAYQKFVQIESNKSKYKDLPGKQRLSAIAEEWKRINK